MVFTKASKNKKSKSIKFVSQNVRGLKSSARLEEVFSYILRLGVFAACLQETWRSDIENLEKSNCALLDAGLPHESIVGRRG